MADNKTVSVEILDKDYQIACPADEELALERAARELDARMRTIRTSGSVIGVERIAVMAALNLCHELQATRDNTDSATTQKTLAKLIKKLDKVVPSN